MNAGFVQKVKPVIFILESRNGFDEIKVFPHLLIILELLGTYIQISNGQFLLMLTEIKNLIDLDRTDLL